MRVAASRSGFICPPDGDGLRLAGGLRTAGAFRLPPPRGGRAGEQTLRGPSSPEPDRGTGKGTADSLSRTSRGGGVLVVAPVPAAYEAAVGRPVHHSVVYRALHRPAWRKI